VLPFVLALVCIAALNIYVNPFRLYWSMRFDAAATNLRLQKYELAQRMQPPPQTVILGSSRVMAMDPADIERYLPGPCFNFGMQAGAAEDYYAALLSLTEGAGLPIRNVVLGIDLEAFNPSAPTIYESRYFPEFSRYLIHTPLARARLSDQLGLLMSMQQTDESLNVLRRAFRRELDVELVSIEPNGKAIQIAREQAIAAGTFDLQRIIASRVRKYPSRSLRLGGYKRVDPVRLLYLDDLLNYCDEHGIRVYAFITPYHPRLWDVLDQLPEAAILNDVKAQVQEHLAAHGVELHDFSHIVSFGGDPQQFYDEIHMRPDNIHRVVEALFGGTAALQARQGSDAVH